MRTVTYSDPAYAGDFPDPCVMVAGGVYWAYSTGSGGRNLQVMSSPDLRAWTAPADPLPELPSWASPGLTWAPRVVPGGDGYLMYYTVHHGVLGVQCISVAGSSHPGGPFIDTSAGPLVCQAGAGGSIDPDPHLDPRSGERHLLWKSDDNSRQRPTHIWGQRLSPDGRSMATGTTPALLLSQTRAWQSGVVEGPAATRLGGRFHLFYAANRYSSAASGIGYATSDSLLGPYRERSRYRPWLATTGRARGPQGPMVFTDRSGATRMAFAAWNGKVGYDRGGVRSLWIGTLSLTRSGRPRLR